MWWWGLADRSSVDTCVKVRAGSALKKKNRLHFRFCPIVGNEAGLLRLFQLVLVQADLLWWLAEE